MSGKLIIEGNAVYELDEEKREAEGWVAGKYPKEDTKK